MKRPGKLIQFPDGRKYILYDKQPLLKSEGLLVLYRLDDSFQPMQDLLGRDITRMIGISKFDNMDKKLIGYCD